MTLIISTWLLIFLRIASILSILPIFGDKSVPIKARIVLSFLMSIVLYDSIANSITYESYLIAAIKEVAIGIIIGYICSLLFTTFTIATGIIIVQSGLGSAMILDPANGSENVNFFAPFFRFIVIVLMLQTNLHYIFLEGILNSYRIMDDVYIYNIIFEIPKILSNMFLVAFKLSFPIMFFVFLMNLIMGYMSRLMPTLQVFFLALPLQIILTFIVMIITLYGSVSWYLSEFLIISLKDFLV